MCDNKYACDLSNETKLKIFYSKMVITDLFDLDGQQIQRDTWIDRNVLSSE